MASELNINLETSLQGFVSTHKNILYVKNQGILLRNDEDFKNDKNSVLLISGGGSGHEVFPAGFIGHGMLSAAICGQIFTSPSATSCLASILLTAPEPQREVLLILNNYTGDRLNFGLAVETAQNVYNYKNIKVIIVDDDCSIENPHISTGRRGLSGINLIMKIAGAMNAKGSSLNEIHEKCSSLLCNRFIRTIGFSFHHTFNELSNIEIGYGIHGEPGALKIDRASNFKPIIDIMIKKLKLCDVHSDVVLLFNNLGGASEFIFYHFIKEFLTCIESLDFKIAKIYAGKFLTSLRKEGIGVTIMEVADKSIIEYLEYPVLIPAKDLYNTLDFISDPSIINFQMPKNNFNKIASSLNDLEMHDSKLIKDILERICSVLIESKDDLNRMDKELGDGDTGNTLSRGAEAILNEIASGALKFNDIQLLLRTISNILMSSMGGTAGAIFSIFFQCASIAFEKCNEHSVVNWMNGLNLGIDGIMKYSKAQIGDRTLLDSLKTGCDSVENLLHQSSGRINARLIAEIFFAGCREGCEKTKNMRPRSGRAAYSLSDKELTFNFVSLNCDPGAYAILLISRSVSEVLQKHCISQ